jgi:hypothetical protein
MIIVPKDVSRALLTGPDLKQQSDRLARTLEMQTARRSKLAPPRRCQTIRSLQNPSAVTTRIYITNRALYQGVNVTCVDSCELVRPHHGAK